MKRVISSVAGLLFFALSQPIWTQESPDTSAPQGLKFSYAVKFVCGASSEAFQEGVVRGFHATAVNIHNPFVQERVTFLKKVARALPYQMSDTVTEFEKGILDPNNAIEVECNEIRRQLPAPMTKQFRTGFLVILSTHKLDVTAVYTSRPIDGEVSTIDVETIRPRKIVGRVPVGLPDLTVTDIDMETLRVDCPQGRGSCVTTVNVEIANIGSTGATAFTTKIVLDPGQHVVVDELSPAGLGAGDSHTHQVVTNPGGNCFDPDCQVCATVDSGSAIEESNESNNMLCETKRG